jgi:4-alpha-glucanotransferase
VPVWPYEVGDQACNDAALPAIGGQWCGIVASLDPEPSTDVEAALGRRLDHDRSVVSTAFSGPAAQAAPPWIVRLALAADAFVLARPVAGVPDGKSVIAGYPWFGDWGRDTISACQA